MSEELRIEVNFADDLRYALKRSDVCVTCTRSTRYFVAKGYIQPGTFIAAVGADSPDKQELAPALLIANKVVVDVLAQCERVGELHHVLDCDMSPRYGSCRTRRHHLWEKARQNLDR